MKLTLFSNQNLSIEMFLIRLIHLKEISNLSDSSLNEIKIDMSEKIENKKIEKDLSSTQNQSINQIKNIFQEKKKR